MIHVKKLDNGVMGFGTIENKNDVEELIEKLSELFADDEDECECECDECEASDECECNDAPYDDLLDALMDALGWDEDEDDECEDEDTDEDECDGLPHVVSIGYTHDYDQVVIMNDRDTKWGLAEAFLRAAAKVWPIEDESDEKLRGALLELAGVAHEHVDSDD